MYDSIQCWSENSAHGHIVNLIKLATTAAISNLNKGRSRTPDSSVGYLNRTHYVASSTKMSAEIHSAHCNFQGF